MKVTVVTHGRYHSFDLAEYLYLTGHLASIITGYPKFKLKNTSVPQSMIKSYPWFVVPGLAFDRLSRFVPHEAGLALKRPAGQALGTFAARNLPPCDLVTALSGSGLEAGGRVQSLGGAYVCDRGSSHIRYQERILQEEYDRAGLRFLRFDQTLSVREEAEYELADAITVPSTFAKRSFIEMGLDGTKIHAIPYGVNLSYFHPCAPRAENFRILFVGALSCRKAIHDLIDAFNLAALPNSELVVVGGKTPETAQLLKGRDLTRISFKGILDRAGVAQEMSRASVMVLPSVEEGLALVQGQALACGCPVIATTNTGAEDLFDDGVEGYILPIRSPERIAERLTCLYQDKDRLHAMSESALNRVRSIGGWDQYGMNAIALFERLVDPGLILPQN